MISAVAVVYFVAAKLSLRLAVVGESVTPLWPPTGIALVAFLWFGVRVWPGIAAAAFLVNLPISPNAAAAAGIAAGNTVAPLVACKLLELSGFRQELNRLRDAVALVLPGALVSMTVSASAGTISLQAAGAPIDFWSTWSVWWAGDAMGILAVAPLLLSFRQIHVRGRPPAAKVVEAVVLFGGIATVALSMHETARPVWVVVFPLVGWVAWRFKQFGAGPAAFIVILVASWAAANDSGPFSGASLLQKMFMLQVFNAAVAFTSFFFAAIVAEREQAVAHQRRSLEREREVQARLYEREHRIAETLQRSLLPDRLPDIPDIVTAARYVPASGEVDVGGDWYDLIPLHDGRLGIVVGDVAGHGVGAASAMGQVRSAFRAYVLEGLSPARTLERLNGLFRELLPGSMATLACAQLDPETGALSLARAGHPPPILKSGGDVQLVEGGLAPPLGVLPRIDLDEVRIEMPTGATLFFYTDGLIERRRESLDQGLRRLLKLLSAADEDLESACDRVVEAMLTDLRVSDDAVLVALRRTSLIGRPLALSMSAQPERLLGIRRILGRWLRQNGWDEEEASDVIVATMEACANVIQHAYGAKEGPMDIGAEIGAGAVTVSVRDFGAWMPPTSADNAPNRGLQLMRGLMNSVELTHGADGTHVVMKRRIRGEARHD